MESKSVSWSKVIILVDMDAFFASIEQLDTPYLRDKPVAVINGPQGSCIITASYEARHFGIKTGMRLNEAKKRCANLQIRVSRPQRYAELSEKIMNALRDHISPDIEIFSIDEAFLDVTSSQKLLGTPEQIATKIKNLIYCVSKLNCSIGVSGDKTTAKFAAKQNKPRGITLIHPDDAEQTLAPIPITELCGIGHGIAKFLYSRGVYLCGDMKHIPIGIIGKRFGHLGRRIWYMCQGKDPAPVITQHSAAKSLGHGKIIPYNTHERSTIEIYLRHMCEKVAMRLRANHLSAQWFFIGFRQSDTRLWIGEKIKMITSNNDGYALFQHGVFILNSYWHGEALCQVQVTALDPGPEFQQADLFDQQHNTKINATLDKINHRFGPFSISPATLLLKTTMHDVIAPSWRPNGSKRSV